MKRIDIIMPPTAQYGVLTHFSKKLHEAMIRNGVQCRLLEAKRDDPGTFLKALLGDQPECTLSFNGLLPDDQGRFLADLVKIPHVAYLVGSTYEFVSMTRSAYTIMACADKGSCDFYRQLGFTKTLFVPHGIEPSLIPDGNCDYDVTMFSSYIDYKAIRASWKKKFDTPVRNAMEEVAEQVSSDLEIPYYQAFVKALDHQLSKGGKMDPQKMNFIEVLEELELYVGGLDRYNLVKAIKDAKVDIFGCGDQGKGWKQALGKQSNVVLHDPIPYDQVLSTMRHSKIVLNSTPWIKEGSHERIFSALASGALVITNENRYLSHQFTDGESIVFYHPSRLDKANHRVNEYLSNEAKRDSVVSKGRQIVMGLDTWDRRVEQLLQELPPLLEQMRK